jgi:hypothetical protein
MAIFDTISFPPTDAITGKPQIDGWTDNIDPGVAAHFPEPGYAAGGRITFTGGSLTPSVSFQCTQVQVNSPADVGLAAAALAPANGSYLAMGFFCTFDPRFDAADGITIGFLPNFAVKDHTTARRIDLLPNSKNVGAGNTAGTDMIPGAAKDYQARLNRTLNAAPAFWKGVGANTDPDVDQTRWQSVAVNNVFARAASWHPTTPSTNATAGQTAPSTGAFTLAVTDTTQFPSFGNLDVPISGGSTVTVTYTGKNDAAKTFTGCHVAGGAGGAVDPAGAVQAQDLAWSVELLVPTTSGALGGGADWIDLQGHFGLYVNLFRFSEIPQPMPPAQPHAGFYAAQYRFPLPDAAAPVADQHYLFGSLNEQTYIGEDWYGQATITALTGGVNDAKGICFQNIASPASSVGVRHLGSANPSTLTGQIYGTVGTVFPNTLVAQIQNTGSNAVNDVTAEFRFGKWGNPPTAFAQWDPHNPKFTTTPESIPTKINLAAGGAGEITADWRNADVPNVYAGDTCMWVRLDSTGNAAFAQDGVRRNIMFTNLSEQEQDATISGSGHPPPESGSDHDFVLMSHVREIVAAVRQGGDIATHLVDARVTEGHLTEKVLGWYWLVETFRRPGLQFTVNGQTGEVLDPSPGQFGAFAQHENDGSDVFVSGLWGGGLKRHGNTYELRVPHNGEVTIHTWMGAGPPGTLKPPKDITDDGSPLPPSCLALLLPFLNWIKKLLP